MSNLKIESTLQLSFQVFRFNFQLSRFNFQFSIQDFNIEILILVDHVQISTARAIRRREREPPSPSSDPRAPWERIMGSAVY